MTSEVTVIRFPDGETEFYAGPGATPSVGDKIARRGAEWLVVRIDESPGARTAISVMPTVVERDQSWPSPQAYVGGTTR